LGRLADEVGERRDRECGRDEGDDRVDVRVVRHGGDREQARADRQPDAVAPIEARHAGNLHRIGVVIEAAVFHLDGVVLASEEVWDDVREQYVRDQGGRYDDEVQRAMMGMSSTEWSRYLHDVACVPAEPEAINDQVVRLMLERYRRHLPLIDGAVE